MLEIVPRSRTKRGLTNRSIGRIVQIQLVNSLTVRDLGSISSTLDTRLYGQGSCRWNKINDRRHARSHSLIPPNLFASINLYFFSSFPASFNHATTSIATHVRYSCSNDFIDQSEWIHTLVSLRYFFFSLIPLFLFSTIIVRSARNAVGWKQQGCRRIESTRDRSTLRK